MCLYDLNSVLCCPIMCLYDLNSVLCFPIMCLYDLSSVLCCPIMCLYDLSSVLCCPIMCPLRFPHRHDVRFVFTSQLFVGGLIFYIRYLCLLFPSMLDNLSGVTQ
jgi:hypothetical protein